MLLIFEWVVEKVRKFGGVKSCAYFKLFDLLLTPSKFKNDISRLADSIIF